MDRKPLIYLFDGVEVRVGAFRVLKHGNILPIEPKAFEVLVYLIEHRNQLVEKEALLNAVWKDAFVTQNAMTRVIAQLRKALKDDAKEARYIETVPTRGYRFIAPVEEAGEAALPQETFSTSLFPESSGGIPGSKRSRVFLAAAGTLFLIIVGLVLFWRTSLPVRTDSSRTGFLPVQFSNSAGLDVAPSFSPDDNQIVYSSDRTGAFEIYIRTSDVSAKELQLTNDGNQNLFPVFSPDGRSVAYSSMRHPGILRIPATGGTPQRLTDFGFQPVWSPDGHTIVFRSGASPSLSVTDYYFPKVSSLWTVPVSGGPAGPIEGNGKPPGSYSAPSWSPDGREIRFVVDFGGESSVWSYAIGDHSFRKLFGSSTLPYSNVRFSADGKRIWFVKWRLNGDIGIWKQDLDPATLKPAGTAQPVYQSVFAAPRDLALSHDGRRLAFTAVVSMSQILMQAIPGGDGGAPQPVPLTRDVTYRYALIRSSPDGTRSVFTSFPRNGRARVWIAGPELPDPYTVGGENEVGNFGSLTSDNNHLVYVASLEQANQRKIAEFTTWNLKDGSSSRQSQLPAGANQVATSPDGMAAAYHIDGEEPTRVYLQNIASGERRVIASGPQHVGYPRFSRDGAWISIEVNLPSGGDDIAIFPAAGGPMQTVLHSDEPTFSAGWMPDNDRILFAGLRNAAWNIYTISRSTKKIEQLTRNELLRTYVRYPDWLAGGKIVYEFNEAKGNIFVGQLP